MRFLPLARAILLSVATIALTCGFCSPNSQIDLRVLHPDVFQNLPILNQGNYGVCYAYSAANLIDYHRLLLHSEHALDFRTSPIFAAETTAMNHHDSYTEGGSICDVVNSLTQLGHACGYNGIGPNQIKGLGDQVQVEIVTDIFMDYILGKKVFHPVDPVNFAFENRKNLDPDQKAYVEKFDDFLSWLKQALASRQINYFSIPSDTEIFTYIQNVQTKNLYDSFPPSFENWIASKNCVSSTFSLPKLTCESHSQANLPSDPMDSLDQALVGERIPVGIDLCANILTQKNYQGYPNRTLHKDCALHALVVIGKKYEGGKCSYLLRNSWGANARYVWPTSGGDVWVSENALSKNVTGISVVR
jgi:hypothetical protein